MSMVLVVLIGGRIRHFPHVWDILSNLINDPPSPLPLSQILQWKVNCSLLMFPSLVSVLGLSAAQTQLVWAEMSGGVCSL